MGMKDQFQEKSRQAKEKMDQGREKAGQRGPQQGRQGQQQGRQGQQPPERAARTTVTSRTRSSRWRTGSTGTTTPDLRSASAG